MKLLNPQIEIDYFGVKLVLPRWARWVTTTHSGAIVVWVKEPVMHAGYKCWVSASDEDKMFYSLHIEDVDLEGMDWKKTKVSV